MDDSIEETQSADPSSSGGGTAPEPMSSPPDSRGRSIRIPLIIAIVLVLLIGGGAAAATVPVYAISAQEQLSALLPSSTAFYVSVDLNPSGATKSDLARIERVFTSQPGWSKMLALARFHGVSQSATPSGECYRQTEGQAMSDLKQLGHQTTLALTSTSGLNLSSQLSESSLQTSRLPTAGTISALKRDFVVLAPIHVEKTLLQSLTGSGFSFALQTKNSVYEGTTIEAETFAPCGVISQGQAQTIYAADYKNWILIGLTPSALHPVIDAANANIPALDTVHDFQSLAAALPANQLFSYFMSGKAAQGLGVVKALKSEPGMNSFSLSALSGLQKATAGTLSVEANGFSVTSLSLHSGSVLSQRAGGLAASLPSNVEAFISIQGLKNTIDSGLSTLEKTGLYDVSGAESYIEDITTDMSGETDLVLFKPIGVVTRSNLSNLPLALMWQVANASSATLHLSEVTQQAHVTLAPAVASDGTTYYRFGATTYGYAVRKGWVIASLDVPGIISHLSHPPGSSLSDLSTYQDSVPENGTPSSLWFINVTDIRNSLETALRPNVSALGWTQYRSQARPLIAPLQSISGSAGTLGTTAYVKLSVGIGSPSNS